MLRAMGPAVFGMLPNRIELRDSIVKVNRMFHRIRRIRYGPIKNCSPAHLQHRGDAM